MSPKTLLTRVSHLSGRSHPLKKQRDKAGQFLSIAFTSEKVYRTSLKEKKSLSSGSLNKSLTQGAFMSNCRNRKAVCIYKILTLSGIMDEADVNRESPL